MSEMMNDVWVAFAAAEGKPDLKVARACNRCYGRSIAVRELNPIECVSPEGTAHSIAVGEVDETTCGIPIGEEWWTIEQVLDPPGSDRVEDVPTGEENDGDSSSAEAAGPSSVGDADAGAGGSATGQAGEAARAGGGPAPK